MEAWLGGGAPKAPYLHAPAVPVNCPEKWTVKALRHWSSCRSGFQAGSCLMKEWGAREVYGAPGGKSSTGAHWALLLTGMLQLLFPVREETGGRRVFMSRTSDPI